LDANLIRASVDNAPPYEAFSYAWNGEQKVDGIIVDIKWLAVTPTVLKLL
jgi:hypothetical protein